MASDLWLKTSVIDNEKRKAGQVKENKEVNVLFNGILKIFLYMVTWHQTYGYGPQI